MRTKAQMDTSTTRAHKVAREAALYDLSWDGCPVMPPMGVKSAGGWTTRMLTHQEAERYHLEQAARTVGSDEQGLHLREAFRHRVWGVHQSQEI